MYEKPELTRVGDAEDVILGSSWDGGDMDMNWSIANNNFEKETIPQD
ncbi:MAG TPA: hypothetical protein VGH38_28785 [Bryobacteraceae bacterium]|jgi:hypothetical protein